VDFLIGGQNKQRLARREKLSKANARGVGEVLAFADARRIIDHQFIIIVAHTEKARGRILRHDFAEDFAQPLAGGEAVNHSAVKSALDQSEIPKDGRSQQRGLPIPSLVRHVGDHTA